MSLLWPVYEDLAIEPSKPAQNISDEIFVDRDGKHRKRQVVTDVYASGRRVKRPLMVSDPLSSDRKIVAKGAPLTKDVMQIEGLYELLAACITEQDALRFIRNCGFPGGGKEVPVYKFFQLVDTVRHLVEIREKQKDLPANQKDWSEYTIFVLENQKQIRLHPTFRSGGAPDYSPEFFFQPATLRDAIIVRLLQDVTTSTNLKCCKLPGCGEWFKVGPGTPHNVNAEYCSRQHRWAHTYAKKPKSKGKRK